jgi:hypothetical protein
VAGYHRWQEAPTPVQFLRDWHRHLFHIRLAVEVDHLDRDIEFFTLKEKLNVFLRDHYEGEKFDKSCEMIAAELVQVFHAEWAEVSEDGENGAIVHGSVATKVRRYMFVGTEVEGPHRGKKVLFIPGSVPLDVIKDAAQRIGASSPVDRIYYGAGNDRNLRFDTLLYLSQIGPVPTDRLDIEIDLDQCWLRPTDHEKIKVFDTLKQCRSKGITIIGFCRPYTEALAVAKEAKRLEMRGQAIQPTYYKWLDGKSIVWTDSMGDNRWESYLDDLSFDKDKSI